MGKINRFYLFSAFSDFAVLANIQVTDVWSVTGTAADGTPIEETHFNIHNRGSATPVSYYFYMSWTDGINV